MNPAVKFNFIARKIFYHHWPSLDDETRLYL